jgi:hypothetical protein
VGIEDDRVRAVEIVSIGNHPAVSAVGRQLAWLEVDRAQGVIDDLVTADRIEGRRPAA